MKRMNIAVLGAAVLMLCSMMACKPKYVSQVDEAASNPLEATISPEAEYYIEFGQLGDDTLDRYSGEVTEFNTYVKDWKVTGDNEDRMVTVSITMDETATKEQAEYFAEDLVKSINDAAYIQDNRIEKSAAGTFGGLWKIYSLKLTCMQGEDILVDLDVKAGEEIPLNADQEHPMPLEDTVE